MDSASDIFALIDKGGTLAMLLIILWTGAKGRWVFGTTHEAAVRRERERADEWKQLAQGTLPIAEKAVDAVERTAGS